MANEFQNHIDKFINSLNENTPEIYYQSFNFSNVNDSRTQLTKLDYDKNKVSFLNLEMVRRNKYLSKFHFNFIR